MKNRIRFYSIVLLFATLGCRDQSAEPPSGSERTGLTITRRQFDTNGLLLGGLERRTFPDVVEVSGKIDVPPNNKSIVTAFMGGYVKKTPLLVGDKVSKGQLLVVLENQEFVKIQQEYLEVYSQLDFLKAEYDRNKTLFEEKIASEKNYLQAKSNYETAVARFQGLTEQLNMLNFSPDRVEKLTISPEASIFSPIAGSITKMNISQGSYVSPATEILEIVNNDHVHLELSVFEKDILKVKKGQQIEFKIPATSAEMHKAEVYLVGTSIDEANRTIKVHGHLEDEDSGFLPGMFVEAMIMTDTVQNYALPEEAIVESEGIPYVLRLVSENGDAYSFERVAVVTGNTFKGYTEIQSDALDGNSRFLVKGVFTLIVE